MAKRIKYPEGVVRTREQIVEQAKAAKLVHAGVVWLTCWNCGGSCTYPSACEPSGLCRLYCWAAPHVDPLHAAMGILPPFKTADDPTRGKLAYSLEKYVKREQASDRRAYRDSLVAEERAAARMQRDRERQAEQARRDAEHAEREARRLAELATRQFVGTIGERIKLDVTALPVKRFAGYMDQTRYLCRFRDAAGNLLVLWTGSLPFRIDADGNPAVTSMRLVATVKEFATYNDEKQTVIQRARCELVEVAA